jgi:hypothetical protein
MVRDLASTLDVTLRVLTPPLGVFVGRKMRSTAFARKRKRLQSALRKRKNAKLEKGKPEPCLVVHMGPTRTR